MVDDRRNGQRFDRRGIGIERLDLGLESRISGGENSVAGLLVVLDPVFPASWGHPEAVDEDDGVWSVLVGAHSLSFPVEEMASGGMRFDACDATDRRPALASVEPLVSRGGLARGISGTTEVRRL